MTEGGRVDASEGRIRELQRIAYGADASDDERARAVAELAQLASRGAELERAPQVEGAVASPDSPDAGDATRSSDAGTPTASDVGAPAAAAPRSSRLLRWTLAVGAAALVIGVGVGLGIGRQVPADSGASEGTGPSASRAPGTPLDATDLLPLFERLPQANEAQRVATVDATIDPMSVRLLAIRTDGPAAFLARTTGGEVCLVLLLPAGPSSISCTIDGRLPADGLRIEYYAQGYGLAVAHLDAAGTVELGLIVSF